MKSQFVYISGAREDFRSIFGRVLNRGPAPPEPGKIPLGRPRYCLLTAWRGSPAPVQ